MTDKVHTSLQNLNTIHAPAARAFSYYIKHACHRILHVLYIFVRHCPCISNSCCICITFESGIRNSQYYFERDRYSVRRLVHAIDSTVLMSIYKRWTKAEELPRPQHTHHPSVHQLRQTPWTNSNVRLPSPREILLRRLL